MSGKSAKTGADSSVTESGASHLTFLVGFRLATKTHFVAGCVRCHPAIGRTPYPDPGHARAWVFPDLRDSGKSRVAGGGARHRTADEKLLSRSPPRPGASRTLQGLGDSGISAGPGLPLAPVRKSFDRLQNPFGKMRRITPQLFGWAFGPFTIDAILRPIVDCFRFAGRGHRTAEISVRD